MKPNNKTATNSGNTVANVGNTSKTAASSGANAFPVQTTTVDHRARLNIKPNDLSRLVTSQDQKDGANTQFSNEYVLGNREDTGNILHPLFKTNGVLYPYTPTLLVSHTADYTSQNYTHSNYGQQAYNYSDISQIQLDGTFTANTVEEAKYTMAVIHFFRTVTKMYFANPKGKVGAPPPILLFNYMGDMYYNVPVVIASFAPTFPADVNYVPISYGGGQMSVPTQMTISIVMKPQYNPYNIKSEFDLDSFRTGKLLKRGYI